MKKNLAFFLILIFSAITAQDKPPFWDDVEQFKIIDAQIPPPPDAVLLLGSSSFTMWKDETNIFRNMSLLIAALEDQD